MSKTQSTPRPAVAPTAAPRPTGPSDYQKAINREARAELAATALDRTSAPKRRGPAKGTAGRPPKPVDERMVDIGVRLDPAEREHIDHLATEAAAPRSEVIRQLIAYGLSKPHVVAAVLAAIAERKTAGFVKALPT